MSDAGRKLLDALQEAVDGKLTRVRMQDGSTWIPLPQWQPIETAPKDGTHILLHSYDFGAVEGFWSADVTNFYKSQVGWASYDPDNAQGDWVSWWLGSSADHRMYCGATPHHWMPLPEPPVTA